MGAIEVGAGVEQPGRRQPQCAGRSQPALIVFNPISEIPQGCDSLSEKQQRQPRGLGRIIMKVKIHKARGQMGALEVDRLGVRRFWLSAGNLGDDSPFLHQQPGRERARGFGVEQGRVLEENAAHAAILGPADSRNEWALHHSFSASPSEPIRLKAGSLKRR